MEILIVVAVIGAIGVFSAMSVLYEYERGRGLSPRQADPGQGSPASWCCSRSAWTA